MPPLALPPGPSLDRATQAVLFHRDPLGFLRRQQERYGDVFTLRMALAGTMVIVADPGAIDAVIGADPDRGHAGEARRRILGIASPSSVLGADGATHRTARRRLEPAFTPQAFDGRRDEMAAIAERHVAAWPRGRPFRLLARIRRLSDEIFVRLVLGVRDDDRARALVRAIRGMIFPPGTPPMPIPGYEAGAVGSAALRVFDRMKAPVERLLTTELDERRARRPTAGADGAGRGAGVLDVVLAVEAPPPTARLVDEL